MEIDKKLQILFEKFKANIKKSDYDIHLMTANQFINVLGKSLAESDLHLQSYVKSKSEGRIDE